MGSSLVLMVGSCLGECTVWCRLGCLRGRGDRVAVFDSVGVGDEKTKVGRAVCDEGADSAVVNGRARSRKRLIRVKPDLYQASSSRRG